MMYSLSAILLVVMDELMRRTTEDKRRGISWRITDKLKDIDFVDEVCLHLQISTNIKDKLKDILVHREGCIWTINKGKNKSLRKQYKN